MQSGFSYVSGCLIYFLIFLIKLEGPWDSALLFYMYKIERSTVNSINFIIIRLFMILDWELWIKFFFIVDIGYGRMNRPQRDLEMPLFIVEQKFCLLIGIVNLIAWYTSFLPFLIEVCRCTLPFPFVDILWNLFFLPLT